VFTCYTYASDAGDKHGCNGTGCNTNAGTEDVFKDVSAYDKTIVEKVQLVDMLDEQEKKGIFSIIDGLVAKQKLKQSLSSALNLAS
jgi:hypothetical protein